MLLGDLPRKTCDEIQACPALEATTTVCISNRNLLILLKGFLKMIDNDCPSMV
jgi:hypothetical protein